MDSINQVEKTIGFYNVIPEPSLLILDPTPYGDTLKEIFQTVFSHSIEENMPYSFEQDGNTFRVDIKDSTNTYLFGTYCKDEDFSKEVLFRTRKLEDNSTGPFLKNPDEFLERFTYFYIDYYRGTILCIVNSKLPRISTLFPALIWNYLNHHYRIAVYPIRTNEKHIDKLISSLKKGTELTLKFSNEDAYHNIPSLPETLSGECEISSTNICFKFSETSPAFLKKTFDFGKKAKEQKEYSGIKLKAINEWGLEETINLIEMYYTKKVNISLDTERAFDTEQILNLLQNELAKSIEFT